MKLVLKRAEEGSISDGITTGDSFQQPPARKATSQIKMDLVDKGIKSPNPWAKNAPKPIPENPYNAARPIPENPYQVPSMATQEKANPLKRIQNLAPKNQIKKPVPTTPMIPKSQELNTKIASYFEKGRQDTFVKMGVHLKKKYLLSPTTATWLSGVGGGISGALIGRVLLSAALRNKNFLRDPLIETALALPVSLGSGLGSYLGYNWAEQRLNPK